MARLDARLASVHVRYRAPSVQRRPHGGRRPDRACADDGRRRRTRGVCHRRSRPALPARARGAAGRAAATSRRGSASRSALADLLALAGRSRRSHGRTTRRLAGVHEAAHGTASIRRASPGRWARFTGRAATAVRRWRATNARWRHSTVRRRTSKRLISIRSSGWRRFAAATTSRPLSGPSARCNPPRRRSRTTSSVTPDVRKAATAAIAHATNTIGVALARSGQLDAARERIERSVTAARELRLLDVACRAYANLGVLYSTVEPKRAIDVSLTGLELASKIGAASLQSYIYANLAAAYCALTDRLRNRGSSGGAGGRQSRPRAGTARSPRRSADRDGADPSVPGRAPGGAGDLSMRRSRWPKRSGSRS